MTHRPSIRSFDLGRDLDRSISSSFGRARSSLKTVHEAWLLGRTFLQLTCRAKEGPAGRGKLTVRNCRVNDVGIR